MPNWCEGTIKFRGKRDDIIRAMTEGLQPCEGGSGVIAYCEEYSEADILDFSVTSNETYWLDGTHRHFIESTWQRHFDASRYGDEDGDFIIALPFRAAWGILARADADRNGLDKFAMKYRVDVRASGFEQGMGFKQTVEVNRHGEVIMDVEENYGHDYARYMWECEMPLLGG